MLLFSFIAINWLNTNGQDIDLNVSEVHSMLLGFCLFRLIGTTLMYKIFI